MWLQVEYWFENIHKNIHGAVYVVKEFIPDIRDCYYDFTFSDREIEKLICYVL